MIVRWILIVPVLGFLGFGSCGTPPKPQTAARDSQSPAWIADASVNDSSPGQSKLPVPMQSPVALGQYRDVVTYPWIRLQSGLTHVTDGMVADVRSLEQGHEELNKRRKQAGLPTNTFEQESDRLISTIQEIQATIEPLKLAFPNNLYSILNIPPAAPLSYTTPLPFDIYKRVELGETDLGIPYYLDVRVFDISRLQSQTAKDAVIQAIINWHLGLLQGGEKAFSILQGKDTLVLLGHGDRNRDHFDGTHGFASHDRGVFLAFFSDGRHLYVLHADAPWSTLKNNKNLFLQVVNRPLTPWNKPVGDYRLVAIDVDEKSRAQ